MINETMIHIMQTCHTIAVAGFSRFSEKAGYYVPAYLQKQGYRIIPVNPNLDEGLGETAYSALTDIPDPVDLVLLFQRSENVAPFVQEAIQIGAKAIWMQLGIEDEAAAATARSAGLAVVQDTCMLVAHRQWRAGKLI
ncbi:MAG: CoA-binding protein [Chloroflexi bacterium]|nr:CoA-binding protein [Chloroflexota bacterium]MBP8057771.1 CoA-binding protein [Chloroflexota bacterium]